MTKKRPKHDPEREQRITMEIVADAFDPEERATAWYCHLEEELCFPFTATCIARREISPLRVNDEVEVYGLPSQDECRHEMFVTIRWDKDGLAVPLSQLKPIRATDDQTKQAVEDWHYWSAMDCE